MHAGSVVINDLIVPTVDPRLAFGGRGLSGFGVTRGAEGLLGLTVVKSIALRHGRFRPHFAPAGRAQRPPGAGIPAGRPRRQPRRSGRSAARLAQRAVSRRAVKSWKACAA